MKFSVVIPVYNRPGELTELLDSLTRQHFRDFEVIVVDDGSPEKLDVVVDRFHEQLRITYFYKPNSGPGPSRNFGFQHSRGAYFVVFDSDCIIPEDYFTNVTAVLEREKLDAWGGPDRASENFTPLQQAMGFTMSSFLTTGGIRGGMKKIGVFQPRSFNMGISRKVFEATGGFRFDRHAEDIELSIRIRKAGFRIGLIQDAYVYHKRRTTIGQFYRQVSGFGKGRALVGKSHPGEVKLTHWFPVFFLAGILAVIVLFFIDRRLFIAGTACYLLYDVAIGVSAWKHSRRISVAMLSMVTAFVQLTGYGAGFIKEKLSQGKRK